MSYSKEILHGTWHTISVTDYAKTEVIITSDQGIVRTTVFNDSNYIESTNMVVVSFSTAAELVEQSTYYNNNR